MAEYVWADGARRPAGVKVTAQAVGDHLERLWNGGGLITPEAVVDDAANPASPLHPLFEWDDTEAARLHREHTARVLIRSVVVKFRSNENEERSYKAFVNVTKSEERGYVSSVTAMSDADMRAQVLRKAWAELQAFRRKFGDMQEFALVFSRMEEIEAVLPPRIAA